MPESKWSRDLFREQVISERTSQILAQKIDPDNWPVIQNAAHAQAVKEFEAQNSLQGDNGPQR